MIKHVFIINIINYKNLGVRKNYFYSFKEYILMILYISHFTFLNLIIEIYFI